MSEDAAFITYVRPLRAQNVFKLTEKNATLGSLLVQGGDLSQQTGEKGCKLTTWIRSIAVSLKEQVERSKRDYMREEIKMRIPTPLFR